MPNKRVIYWNIPIAITILRMALIPVFAISFYLPFESTNYLTIGLFVFLSVTDWLDGYIARYTNQTTDFGAFLDPVADKLVVCCALVILVAQYPNFYMITLSIVIISREIAVSALREWMSGLSLKSSVSVSMIGKIKTVFQFLAILFLINKKSIFLVELDVIHNIGIALLFIASILTLVSMCYYLNMAWQRLKD